MVFTPNGGKRKSEYTEEDGEITSERISRMKSIKWCKVTGVEILEKQDWASHPNSKVTGKEAMVDGEKSSGVSSTG
jgi:hypothetical protein